MLFNSLHFLIFFPIVVAGYFLLPQRFRWAFLLAASCYFYAVFYPPYLLILFATIIVDYFAGILIEGATGAKRKWILVASIVSNVGFLAFFKYGDFFIANMNELAAFFHWNYSMDLLAILLPIGLSFHTFQAMSYTIEVYRGKQKAERHLGIYALYVMFFPQLVAGPIERPQNLLPQFRAEHKVNIARIRDGLELMLWGLIKKMVIADNLAPGVNVVFNNPQDFSGTSLAIATVFFAYQIYCDFSGYSDIARGAARVLGFELMLNFNHPYSARSISEFWTKWHISLSTWFRDYLYIPMGGNRVPALKMCLSILIVFLVSGFWHGANWTFVIWGALHGTYIVAGIITQKIRTALFGPHSSEQPSFAGGTMGLLSTFILVNLGWIFFRANSLDDAFYIVTHLFQDVSFDAYALTLSKGKSWLIFVTFLVLLLETIQYLVRNHRLRERFASWSPEIRGVILATGVVTILLAGATAESQFIYFQF